MSAPPGPIRGRADRADRLVEADEPLAALQRRCGGEMPGGIAIPALLALVRRARSQKLRLACAITASDEGQLISLWAEVEPGPEGVGIELSHWRLANAAAAVPGQAPAEADTLALLRQIAEGHALLDGNLATRFAAMRAPALEPLGAAMTAAPERPFTQFIAVDGIVPGSAVHWRLLDGALVWPWVAGAIDGDAAGEAPRWQARLSPVASGGFELFLVPERIDELPGDAAASAAPARTGQGVDEAPVSTLLARDFAPALKLPVNRIIANAESIRTRLAGPLDDAYAAYAADIASSARHLLSLIEDMADLEAVDRAGFTTARDALDLTECAEQAAGILAVRASRRGIALVLPPREAKVPAVGELRRVLQVLLNLVGNAILYSPEGSTVRIECGHSAQEQGGAQAWIAVADEGPGLTAEQAAKVFGKFERLGRDGDGGSGLGLYISKRLARAMRGDLTVTATPGAGARFTLTLPTG